MIEELTPREFLECRGVDDTWQLVDVREPWEIELVSVPGAIKIPLAEVSNRCSELDDGSPVAVMCHAGVRSMKAAVFLAQNGFGTVANISGGIDAWAADIDPTMTRY